MIENGIAFILGAVTIFLALRLQQQQRKLKKAGLVADGIVHDLEHDSSASFNIRYPVVRFVTATKEWITETATTGMFPGFYKQGQHVTIIYDPHDPKQFCIDSQANRFIGHLLLTVGIVLIFWVVYKLVAGS